MLDSFQVKLLATIALFGAIAILNSLSPLIAIRFIPAGTLLFVFILVFIIYSFRKKELQNTKLVSVHNFPKFSQRLLNLSATQRVSFTITAVSTGLILFSLYIPIESFLFKKDCFIANEMEMVFVAIVCIVLLLFPVLIGIRIKSMKTKSAVVIFSFICFVIDLLVYYVLQAVFFLLCPGTAHL